MTSAGARRPVRAHRLVPGAALRSRVRRTKHDGVLGCAPARRSAPACVCSAGSASLGEPPVVDFDGEHVWFRWRDYAHGYKVKVMCLDAGEFIRRFLLHVLPRGFTRLRHSGVLANRARARNLALCRTLLAQPEPEPREPESPQAMMRRLTGIDITVCRACGVGTLTRVLALAAQIHTPMRVPASRPP